MDGRFGQADAGVGASGASASLGRRQCARWRAGEILNGIERHRAAAAEGTHFGGRRQWWRLSLLAALGGTEMGGKCGRRQARYNGEQWKSITIYHTPWRRRRETVALGGGRGLEGLGGQVDGPLCWLAGCCRNS